MPCALVTGASRGIGRAIALALAQSGYCVAANYLSSHSGASAAIADITRTGAHGIAVRADVSDPQACRLMVQRVLDEFGRIDLLVNNAGISCSGLFSELSPADWQRLWNVNVTGAVNCTQAVAGHMLSRHSGAIINISSIWGVTGASCEAAYSATKAAVIGLTKALAKEWGPSGIRVNCIAPGVIDTQMNAALSPAALDALRQETPLCRIGTPEDVARAAVFLASDQASFITGAVIGVDGGLII